MRMQNIPKSNFANRTYVLLEQMYANAKLVIDTKRFNMIYECKMFQNGSFYIRNANAVYYPMLELGFLQAPDISLLGM